MIVICEANAGPAAAAFIINELLVHCANIQLRLKIKFATMAADLNQKIAVKYPGRGHKLFAWLYRRVSLRRHGVIKCLKAVFLKVRSKNPKGSLRRVFGGLNHSRGLNLLLVESTLIRQRQSLADCFSKAWTSVCVCVCMCMIKKKNPGKPRYSNSHS